MGVRLPEAYQEVEYIRSTGYQFINISDEYNQYEYSAVAAFMTTRNQYACLCGWSDDTYVNTNIGYSGKMSVSRSNGRNTSESASVTSADCIGQKLKFDCFKNYARISNPDTGVVLAENTDYFELIESPVWLFHCDSPDAKGYMRTRYVNAKLYGFKVYLSGDLIHDLVPCYRKSDSKPGMYDLVTKQFFTNAGTGEFTVGPDVIDSISPLMVAWRRGLMKSPYLYKLPSPVTFNGSTDFLDTGVKLMEEDIDFSIELSFVQGEDTKVNYSGVFYCVSESGAYPGISLQKYSNKAYYCIGGAGSDVYRVLTDATYSPGTEIRMVIRKVKGETTRTIDFAVDGVRKARANKPGDWEKNKNNVSLLLGCCIQTNGNRFRYWAGTINDFKIKNMVVSDAYVDKYLTAN